MKKLLRQSQGLISVCIAVVVWWASAGVIHSVDPTAGSYDTGALNGLLMGVVAYMLSVWLAWLVLQLEFPSFLNKYIDHLDLNSWAQDWRVVKPEVRIWFLLAVWTILLCGAIACLLGWR